MDKASDVAQAAKEKGGEVKDTASETAQAAKEKAYGVNDKASEKGEEVKDRAHEEKIEAAKEKISEAAQYARNVGFLLSRTTPLVH